MTKEQDIVLTRNLTPYGVRVHGIRYSSPALQRFMTQFGVCEVHVKVQPRDLRFIHVRRPGGSTWIKAAASQMQKVHLEPQELLEEIKSVWTLRGSEHD
jgi:hypothetical protein